MAEFVRHDGAQLLAVERREQRQTQQQNAFATVLEYPRVDAQIKVNAVGASVTARCGDRVDQRVQLGLSVSG